MRDLGHMVEHILGLSDLILVLVNDVLVIYDLNVANKWHALGVSAC
jgi:hypothetical protein